MHVKPVRSPVLTGALADLHGRGARSNRESRFSSLQHERDPDVLDSLCSCEHEAPPQAPATRVVHERARTIISRNQSPDIPFDRSINPYRGCEHGCIYCYARPSHAYLGHSPGLDFETWLYAKDNAAEQLVRELCQAGYRAAPIALGANTDPYQPIERSHRITRSVIEVLAQCEHPLTITTKSALVLRDLDLLVPMAQKGLVHVWISIATLDGALARALEPRAAAPARRIAALAELAQAGVPCGVLTAPVIPALTDTQMEAVLERAAAVGARQAAYVALRLPRELRELFTEWLRDFHPQRAEHVLSILRQMGGESPGAHDFGQRMKGTGIFATLLRQRFALACRRFGLSQDHPALDCSRFRAPSPQQALF